MRHPLLQKYDRLIDFFGQVLGQDYELSLFDLRAEGCPLIFTAGGLNSGRPLGTPLTAAGENYSESRSVGFGSLQVFYHNPDSFDNGSFQSGLGISPNKRLDGIVAEPPLVYDAKEKSR